MGECTISVGMAHGRARLPAEHQHPLFVGCGSCMRISLNRSCAGLWQALFIQLIVAHLCACYWPTLRPQPCCVWPAVWPQPQDHAVPAVRTREDRGISAVALLAPGTHTAGDTGVGSGVSWAGISCPEPALCLLGWVLRGRCLDCGCLHVRIGCEGCEIWGKLKV